MSEAEKIFCDGCRNFWRKYPQCRKCEIKKGLKSTWRYRSIEHIETADPEKKNANNDCKDFRETTITHIFLNCLMEGLD